MVRVAEKLGWRYVRIRGSHMVLEFPEVSTRNLSVPDHREVHEGTIRSLIDTMGLTVDQFLELAKRSKTTQWGGITQW